MIPLRWLGPYLDISGYGMVSFNMVSRFIEDPDFRIQMIRQNFMDWKGKPRRTIKLQNDKVTDDYLSLTHSIPSWFTRRKRAKANIIMTTFECNDLPVGWLSFLREADMIITFSDFDKSLFQKYHDNVEKISHGVAPAFHFDPVLKKDNEFTLFLPGDYNLRKGVDLTLKAYKILLERHKDVNIIIKSYASIKQRWLTLLSELGITKFTLITEDYTEEELNVLYQRSHVVPFPTRGEGFGLTGAEALATKIPLIVTDYSGVRDYANDSNSTLLSYMMKDIPQEFYDVRPMHKGLQWAEPNFDELLEGLETIYTHGPNITKVEKGYQDIKLFTWDRVYSNLKHILIDIYRRNS